MARTGPGIPSFADHAVCVNCVIDFCGSRARTGAASANGMTRHATRARLLTLVLTTAMQLRLVHEPAQRLWRESGEQQGPRITRNGSMRSPKFVIRKTRSHRPVTSRLA